jgi:hypothetical protein
VRRAAAGARAGGRGVVVAAAAGCALAVGLAGGGCSAVLGMGAPTLDPCAQGPCPDGSPLEATIGGEGGADTNGGGADADASTGDDVTPGDDGPPTGDGPAGGDGGPVCVEASAPDAATGIRCGGGCYPLTFCTGTSVCCQTTSAGVTKYACVANEAACGGYTIKCANENDCGGNDVCCHFSTHTVCDSDTTCAGSIIACVPGSPSNDCNTGKKCDVQLVSAGVSTPYYGCEP